jgi:hypothetical protein
MSGEWDLTLVCSAFALPIQILFKNRAKLTFFSSMTGINAGGS